MIIDLERRQSAMRERYRTQVARYGHVFWEDFSRGMPKRRCSECDTPFVTTKDSAVCGHCKAKKANASCVVQ